MVAANNAAPLVTVIIPTHDHASTVDLAMASVLSQSLDSLELVVIGDGVQDDTREVMAAVADPRVCFIDEPKTPSRAELVRHRVLLETRSDYVFYLGDDDVMLPDHVATLVDILHSSDFTHPLPLFIFPDGTLSAHPTDLSQAECRQWHLHPERNAVSLSGVAHRVDSYRRLPTGWREPPTGRWSDHIMWQQWFGTEGMRYVTSDRLTVLKFESRIRTGWTPSQRRDEMIEWIERSHDDSFPAWLDRQALRSMHHAASITRVERDGFLDSIISQRIELDDLKGELDRAHRDGRVSERALDSLREDQRQQGEWLQISEDSRQASEHRASVSAGELKAVVETRTWRLRQRVITWPPVAWLLRR